MKRTGSLRAYEEEIGQELEYYKRKYDEIGAANRRYADENHDLRVEIEKYRSGMLIIANYLDSIAVENDDVSIAKMADEVRDFGGGSAWLSRQKFARKSKKRTTKRGK